MCKVCQNDYSSDHTGVLHINNCDKVTDISGIIGNSRLMSIEIKGCNQLRKIHHIKYLYNLRIEHCQQLTEISFLDKIDWIVVNDCPNMNTMRNAKVVKMIYMSKCPISKFPSVSHLEELRICECDNIVQLPNIRSIRKLIIVKCNKLTKIPDIPRLVELYIRSCPQHIYLTNADRLRSITKIESPNCYFINIETLTCIGCYDMDDYYSIDKIKKWYKRMMNIQKIWQILEIYYSPGYAGYYRCKQDFELLQI